MAAEDTVELAADHPGVADPDYRHRRDEIARAARDLPPGAEAARIAYTDAEHATWATAAGALRALHRRHACAAYLDGAARLDLPRDRVPQLADVSQRLQSLTGFRFHASPGLAPIEQFYGALAERRFLSTQYVRHPSVPLYTPEPDVIHELIGHANALAEPRYADLYATAGRAAGRVGGDELQRFSRVFWFTLEFGVVRERGATRAYGAGLLSSFGELNAFHQAELRGWDLDEMAVTSYDIDPYQPVLFAAPSFDTMVADLTQWFESLGR